MEFGVFGAGILLSSLQHFCKHQVDRQMMLSHGLRLERLCDVAFFIPLD